MGKDKKDKKKKEKPKRQIVKKAAKPKAKKKWFSIVAPKSFNNHVLGESLVENADKLVGKSITVNLMHLTNDMRNQGIEIRFKVVKTDEGKGLTSVTGYEVLPGQMKRVVRRGRSKVMDSFIVRCGDVLVRIKPIVFTANRASAGAQTTIRLAVREKIKHLLKGTTFDQLVQELIQHKLQRTLKDVGLKTHPIKSVEVKSCAILRQKPKEAAEEPQEPEPAVEKAEEPAPAEKQEEAEPAKKEAAEPAPEEK